MKRDVVEIETLHERASATPDPRRPAPRLGGGPAMTATPSAGARAAAVADDDATLRGRQLRFAHAMTMPESLPGALDTETAAKWLTAGPRMTAVERLAIYRRAYHARLVECLADDYPVTQHALGEAEFEDLCARYIARHPSTGPSLNYFGRHMSAFVRDGAPDPLPMRGFVADLTRLEWAIVEVVHAAGEPALTPEGLRDVPPTAWGDLRLAATPAFRLLRFDHPVNAYFQAFREDRDPVVPAPAPSATVVYRSGPTLWRMDLTEPMARVLAALVAGETLGEALGRAEEGLAGLGEAEIASRVTTWFREWVSHGLFVRAEW